MGIDASHMTADISADIPDSDIVKQSLEHKEAFGVLISRYESKLDRYIRRLGVSGKEDREDILQDVFVAVYRNLNGFDTALSFSSWIYRITHNETMSWYRKRRVRPEGHLVEEGEEVLLTVSDEEAGAEALLEGALNAERLNDALQRLDARYRNVIVLRYFEHKEYNDISDILKIPIGSVATLLHRAKKKLKTELEQMNA